MEINQIQWDRNRIWEGSILASIAHAVMVAHYPELDFEHSWDNFNYNIQNGSGVRGTITFHPKYLIAAFQNEDIIHLFNKETKDYLLNAPNEIIQLAESETFQYLLDNVDGKTIPVVTNVVWGEKEFFSIDTELQIKEKTNNIFDIQIKTLEEGLKYWEEYYEMNEEQIELVKELFEEKIKNPKKEILLTKKQKKKIGTNDKEGLEQSKISFSEINIIL